MTFAGNGNATVDNSTVFLDYVGALGGGTAASWTNSSANKAVDSLGYQITSVVRQGFIARAAADWQVTHGFVTSAQCISSMRFASILMLGAMALTQDCL